MNIWKIPTQLENEIRHRDVCCVYCSVIFDQQTKKNSPTREHIINDADIITRENIALCCCSCNASKGAKKLQDWLQSDYCKGKNIQPHNVAPVIQNALKNN